MSQLEGALQKGDDKLIAEVTAKLQQSYVNDGAFLKAWKFVQRNIFGMKDAKVKTVAESLKDTGAIAEKTKLLTNPPKTFKQFLKPGLGPNAMFFALSTLAFDIGKISTAFQRDKENELKGKDTNNGWKQVAQSVVKSVGTALGWTVGEATGKWAFAKIGAKIGTMFGPGIGTAIGGVIGFVGGGLGMCLLNKLSRGIMGHDVADSIDAENLAKTNEGQAQLLEYTIQQAQSGKAIPIEVQNATMKILNQYA